MAICGEVKRDLSDSAAAFKCVVWPKISNWFGIGGVELVEGITVDAMARKLDVLGGIDAWHIRDGVGMRGIASRVQFGKKWYQSFTIRKKRTSGAETEWDKRRRALDNPDAQWLFPALTVHAYVDSRKTDDAKLLYACAAQTKDIYKYADDKYKELVWTLEINPEDGNEFAIFWTKRLRNEGIKIREYFSPDVISRSESAA